MRNPAKLSRLRLFGQVAAVALLAGLSAGCSSDVSRFGNLFDVTENRAQIVQPDQVMTGSIAAAPTTAVTSGALPPPPATTPVVQSAQGLQAPGAVAQPTAVASAPAAGGGDVYVVRPGDSLGRIANDRGLRSIELASFNGIDPAAPIRVGQKLRIPASGVAPTQVASLDTRPAGAVSDAPQTLGQIRTTTPATAAAPGESVVTQPAVAAPAVPETPAPVVEQQTAAVQPPAPTAPQVNTGTGVESSTTGSFRWPVRGRVVSGFGVKANGARNDGINIEVPEGTPIKAAEGGTVIYAGNELKGYGNLVLVKHPNGFVTAYAHASEILVKRDDVIMRGQTIGKVGATGEVPRPQLHFEIREGNKPVDPLPHLSG